jgi:ComF family protein
MGVLNVKNTIVERMLQIVAPRPCSGCGKVGSILCDYCKYDIINEPFHGCILCGTPNLAGICSSHNSPIQRAFTVSIRDGVLETVVNQFKFERVKSAGHTLATLLDESLPLLPDSISFVPVPTVRSHVRQRGYDQVELITRHLCVMRGNAIEKLLVRKDSRTQHQVGKQQRQEQASHAFELGASKNLHGRTLLLVDDIVTTGATLTEAARVLTKAGATVWVVTLAYQPLD